MNPEDRYPFTFTNHPVVTTYFRSEKHGSDEKAVAKRRKARKAASAARRRNRK